MRPTLQVLSVMFSIMNYSRLWVVSPEDYVTADEKVESTGELTNADITAQVQKQHGIDEDDDNDYDDSSIRYVEPIVTLARKV